MSIRRAGLRHQRAPDVHGCPGPIWPPTRLPGCVAWYDMLETYTESGGNVTAIRNMVTGSDDMAEATNPPALDLTGINGRPCMVPDGTNDIMLSTEASVVAAFAGVEMPVTVTAVYLNNGGVSRILFGAGNSGVSGARTYVFRHTSLARALTVHRIDDAGRTAQPGVNATGRSPTVVSAVVSARYWDLVQDGKLSSRAGPEGILVPTGQLTANRVGLFCRPDSGPDGFWPNPTGCLIIHAGTLDIASVRGLQAALMGRWGLST